MKGRLLPYLLLAMAAMLGLILVVSHMALDVSPRKLQAPLATLPSSLGPWHAIGTDQKMDQATLDLLGPQDYILRVYTRRDGAFSALFIAFFGTQRQGNMIHSPRHCLPGSGWQIFKRNLVEVASASGPLKVNHLIMVRDLERLSVLYWYQGRGRIEYNEYLDRAQLVWDGLIKKRSDGALVRLTAPLPRDNQVQKVLQSQIGLAKQLIPALKRIFPRADD